MLIVPAREGALRVLRAARDAGVKRVSLWLDIEAVPANGYWSERQQSLYETLLKYRLIVPGTNRFGEKYVDPYEAAPGTAKEKPHVHFINTWGDEARKTMAADVVKVVGETHAEHYSGLQLGPFLAGVKVSIYVELKRAHSCHLKAVSYAQVYVRLPGFFMTKVKLSI